MKKVFIHPKALVETRSIGPGTKVWAFAHVMDGAKVGSRCNVCGHCFIESGAEVGDDCIIKNGALIWDGVTLEDAVFVGPGAVFTNDPRPRSRGLPEAAPRYARREAWLVRTTVRAGASIGAAAVILPGVEIGAFAMVAAGAVVTRSVPPFGVVAGVPARPAGWVCACGSGLRFSGDRARCSACGKAYERHSGKVSFSKARRNP
ncbi:MAG: N-acetyltransferase [Elusimicrobia bacterium]|nr:N-acetyltransferase [Elusimicrobiota bacterium]